ncbi:MAG: HAD domain-containing protein [Burkholderiaceae bacterium]
MKICYLDYDAVLHDGNVLRNRTRGMYIKTPGRTFFEWMPILDELFAPYPDLQIVLSTMWVRELGFNEAKYELSPSLRDRVIGATFLHPKIVKTDFDRLSRGMQIWGDVERRKPSHWFALDDDAFGWPAACKDNLILTSDQLGVSDPAVQEKIRQRLAEMYSTAM